MTALLRILGFSLLVLLAIPAAAEDADDRAEARQEVTADRAKAADLRQVTERGKNLSDMRLGLFAIHLLNEMSDGDAVLYGFVHRDDHSTIGYLEEVFQYHSSEEVAALEALGPEPHRQVARAALEMLRHIPDGAEPPETQARDRGDLAAALARLEAALKVVLDGIPQD